MEILTPQTGLIFWTIIIALFFVLWLIALIDILRNSFAGENEKLIWILAILFVPIVGAVLYFTIGRKRRVKVN